MVQLSKRERLVLEARNYLFVREVGGPNLGLWVGIFQRFVGIDPGQSWCAAFVCYVLAVIFGGKGNLPIPCTGVVHEILTFARERGMVVPISDARFGDLFVYVDGAGRGHHIGFWTRENAPDPISGISGNTSADGRSSNGDGVHEHQLLVAPVSVVTVRLPLD